MPSDAFPTDDQIGRLILALLGDDTMRFDDLLALLPTLRYNPRRLRRIVARMEEYPLVFVETVAGVKWIRKHREIRGYEDG
jgi:DNA-binding HxlR family transcriptional regulator